jgi:hypothetical protein
MALVRLYKSLVAANPAAKSIHATDLLRAAVVFLHASLEEVLRALSVATLSHTDAAVINEIPLTGVSRSGRPEKFFLGELV